MNIFTLPDKVIKCKRFTGGNIDQNADAVYYLIQDKDYTVLRTEVSEFSTMVFLQGEDMVDISFNSTYFENVTPQTIEEDSTHPDYNKFPDPPRGEEED